MLISRVKWGLSVCSYLGLCRTYPKDLTCRVTVYDPQLLASVLELVPTEPRVVCVVSYGSHSPRSPLALLSHIPSTGQNLDSATQTAKCHVYSTTSQFFVFPDAVDYHGGSASVAHSRSLVFLRKHIGGPQFDLEAIWEEHTYFEFEVRYVGVSFSPPHHPLY